MLQEKHFKRECARKTSISGIYGPVEGEAATRASILATIVGKNEDATYKSMLVDDGTGQIQLRFFNDGAGLFEKPQIGDFTLIIGKARSYMNESYIAPEIIRKLDNPKWAEVRRLELQVTHPPKPEAAAKGQSEETLNDVVSREKVGIYRLVKELDSGRGADMADVTAKAAIGNAETLIKEMLKAGDLFEVLPGKL